MLNPTLGEVVLSLLVVAMGSVVLFLFIVVIKKFRLDRLNNKEVGALMLVCFLSGIILEAYLAGDQSMEAFVSSHPNLTSSPCSYGLITLFSIFSPLSSSK